MMKSFLTFSTLALLAANTAFAYTVDCEKRFVRRNEDKVTVNMDVNDWGTGWARVYVQKPTGERESFTYDIYDVQRWGSNRVIYTGMGYRLEIDLGFDQYPRIFYPYQSELEAQDVQNRATQDMTCRYN